jgi:hypothetical protein
MFFLGCRDCCRKKILVLQKRSCTKECGGEDELFIQPGGTLPGKLRAIQEMEVAGNGMWNTAKQEAWDCEALPTIPAVWECVDNWGSIATFVHGCEQAQAGVVDRDGTLDIWFPSGYRTGFTECANSFVLRGNVGRAGWIDHVNTNGQIDQRGHYGRTAASLGSAVSFLYARSPDSGQPPLSAGESFADVTGATSLRIDFRMTDPTTDYPQLFRYISTGSACVEVHPTEFRLRLISTAAAYSGYQLEPITFGYGSSATIVGMIDEVIAGNVISETSVVPVATNSLQSINLTAALQYRMPADNLWWFVAIYHDPVWWPANPLPAWPGSASCFNFKYRLSDVSCAFLESFEVL